MKRYRTLSAACRLVLLGVVLAPLLMALPLPAIAQAPADTRPYQLDFGVKIPMADGTKLSATLYRPTRQATPLPVVMVMTPYIADRYEDLGSYFAQHGYVFAAVDSRGRGDSGGEFDPWIHEGDDGATAVQWLAAQSFADGRVVTLGGSYSGKNQWAMAARAPAALRAIAPAAAGYVGYDMGMARNIPFPFMQRWLTYLSGKVSNVNLYSDDAYWVAAYFELSRGEVPYSQFDLLSGNPSPIWRKWIAHTQPDGYWAQGSVSREALASIRIPVLAITGTYDDAQLGSLRFWGEHRGGTHKATPDRDFLIIGPWDHSGTREPRLSLGGLAFDARSAPDLKALHVQWYDWILKAGARPPFLTDHVMYYVAGSEEWRAAPDLEGAAVPLRTYYLSSNGVPGTSIAGRGQLVERPPRTDADTFVYDPGLPAHNEGFEGGKAVGPDYLTSDALMRRLSGDGLVYDTPVFATATDLVGRPRATLAIRLDVPDTDFRVQLYEVTRDGQVIYLSQDTLRARYRNSEERAQLVPIGRIERYRFDRFYWIARTIAAGSRVRMLIVPLGASIHNQRNRNSGGVVAEETARDNRVAHIEVELGPGRSTIELPLLLPGVPGGAAKPRQTAVPADHATGRSEVKRTLTSEAAQ